MTWRQAEDGTFPFPMAQQMPTEESQSFLNSEDISKSCFSSVQRRRIKPPILDVDSMGLSYSLRAVSIFAHGSKVNGIHGADEKERRPPIDPWCAVCVPSEMKLSTRLFKCGPALNYGNINQPFWWNRDRGRRWEERIMEGNWAGWLQCDDSVSQLTSDVIVLEMLGIIWADT